MPELTDIPEELVKACLNQLPSRDLRSVRLVCRKLKPAASECLFRHVVLEADRASTRRLLSILDNGSHGTNEGEKIINLVKMVTIRLQNDPSGDAYAEPRDPDFTSTCAPISWTTALNRLDYLERLIGLTFELDRTAGSTEADDVCRVVLERIARTRAYGENTYPLRALTIKNLRNYEFLGRGASQRYRSVLADLKELHVLTAAEHDPTHPCPPLGLDSLSFSASLTHLTLYRGEESVDGRSGIPPLSPKAYFHNLQVLTLGNVALGADVHIDWITSNAKTIKKLSLDITPMAQCVTFKTTCSTVKEALANMNHDQTLKHVLNCSDLTTLKDITQLDVSRSILIIHLRNTWSAAFRAFQEHLHHLEELTINSSSSYYDYEVLFDERYKLIGNTALPLLNGHQYCLIHYEIETSCVTAQRALYQRSAREPNVYSLEQDQVWNDNGIASRENTTSVLLCHNHVNEDRLAMAALEHDIAKKHALVLTNGLNAGEARQSIHDVTVPPATFSQPRQCDLSLSTNRGRHIPILGPLRHGRSFNARTYGDYDAIREAERCTLELLSRPRSRKVEEMIARDRPSPGLLNAQAAGVETIGDEVVLYYHDGKIFTQLGHKMITLAQYLDVLEVPNPCHLLFTGHLPTWMLESWSNIATAASIRYSCIQAVWHGYMKPKNDPVMAMTWYISRYDGKVYGHVVDDRKEKHVYDGGRTCPLLGDTYDSVYQKAWFDPASVRRRSGRKRTAAIAGLEEVTRVNMGHGWKRRCTI